jgi:hypothetical protein
MYETGEIVMNTQIPLQNDRDVTSHIIALRGQKVIIDTDLACIYGVEPKVLNQSVKRNMERFPSDFMFALTQEEWRDLSALRSQIVTLKRGEHSKYPPKAFTEHGAIMAANVLSSPQAIEMSVFVVRAFVKLREQFLNRAEIEKRLEKIENALSGHDAALRELYQRIRPLILPPQDPPRKPIGFSVRESRSSYTTVKPRRR